MAPSPLTFSPSKYQFNSLDNSSQDLVSSDGVFQVKDIEGASVFVEGVQVPYANPAVYVNGYWLTHETNRNGRLTLNSWSNQEALEHRSITAEFNITKIEFSGLTYYPVKNL